MESNWSGRKEAITSTYHEVLGHKDHHHTEWMIVYTLNKIQERRNKKAAINTSRTRAQMEDVRNKRGADIAPDHYLLVVKMTVKLKKHWTMGWTISQKFNTAFLQDADKLNKFKIVLSNRFQAIHDLLNGEGTTMDSNWNGRKEAITSTCHEVLGHKEHHHKE
ncbi:unnamed protein product [Schistosoma margrebowiei]|uniref:Uncharacterized protein n=1 Tax=Schistosoma margrebowiei TaxID=48269 RepID=A0A183NCW5_9TREM|nr:unnamed protein product [Schistosoma margrebowiei]